MNTAHERALLLFSLSLAQAVSTLTGEDVHHDIDRRLDGSTDLVRIDTANYHITITPGESHR